MYTRSLWVMNSISIVTSVFVCFCLFLFVFVYFILFFRWMLLAVVENNWFTLGKRESNYIYILNEWNATNVTVKWHSLYIYVLGLLLEPFYNIFCLCMYYFLLLYTHLQVQVMYEYTRIDCEQNTVYFLYLEHIKLPAEGDSFVLDEIHFIFNTFELKINIVEKWSLKWPWVLLLPKGPPLTNIG